MSIKVTAVYEQGVLKPEASLALPEHARVRVTVERLPVVADERSLRFDEAESGLMLDGEGRETPVSARYSLGRRLRSLRAEVVDSGAPLLNWEGIEDEVAARRGGAHEDL